jgi:hypothetical protein
MIAPYFFILGCMRRNPGGSDRQKTEVKFTLLAYTLQEDL